MFENTSSKNSSEYNADTSVPKLSAVAVVNVLAAGLLGFVLKAVIGDGGLTVGNMVAVVGASILFLSVFVLQTLFIKSFKLQVMLVGLETAAIVLPFIMSWSASLLLATVVLFAFLLKAVKGGMDEMENQIKIEFFPIEKRTLPAVITALSIFVSILFVSVNGLGAAFISKDAFRVLLKPADPIIQSLLVDDFSIDMSIAKFAEALAEKQLGEAFTVLPPAEKSQAMAEVIRQLHAQVAGYGITFSNTDSVSDVFYTYFVKQFNQIPKNFRSLIPFVIFFLTYFTIRSLAGLLRWVVSVPVYVLFQFLLSTGFARITQESRNREIIIVG